MLFNLTQAQAHVDMFAAHILGSKFALTSTRAHVLQAAFDLVFAELSKILAAVTVFQSCQPLPSDIHSAEPYSAAYAKSCGESAVTQTSASAKSLRRVHIPKARPGQPVSQAEVFSSQDTEALASDSLEVRTQDGLSAVKSVVVVKVDIAQKAAASAVDEGRSVSTWEIPRQTSSCRAQEIAHADPEISGKMSDSTRSRRSLLFPSNAGTAAGSGSAKVQTQLPRLASRAPDLRVCTPDREVQLKHHNGHSRTTLH